MPVKMFLKCKIIFVFLLISLEMNAQYVPIIEVPDEIEFAGMKLKLSNGAKKILEKDIANITKNAKYYQLLVDRANLYFPIIEKVFEEEGFPKDFKFLALQESSLISDAVSSSNAVGYWQFKKESAIEVGLRVDNKVDERMNIVSSSRGATRYLSRNNQTFNNWIYSLMSYNTGLGGAKPLIDQSYVGATKMKINEDIHWYVLRFLATKLAFQYAIEKSAHLDSVLVVYIDGANKSLSDISSELQVETEQLKKYNKWLKSHTIPEDKIYSVIVSVPISQASKIASASSYPKTIAKGSKLKKEKFPSISDINFEKLSTISFTLVVNGVEAILAKNGDNSVKLSAQGGITKSDFLKINEMKSFEEITPGKVYYLAKKKNKALVNFHTVQYDETLWEIAQNYGIKIESIRKMNRMDKNEAIEAGRVLWLKKKRPKNKNVEYKKVEENKPNENNITVLPSELGSTEQTKPAVVLEKDKYNYHIVKAGETIFGISRLYQIPTDSLVEWNTIINYEVKVNQPLIVAKKIQPSPILYHEVLPGDTFYKISKQYNISEEQLKMLNNKTDNVLKIGEKLIIKK